MTAPLLEDALARYRTALTEYLNSRSEKSLYQASLLGQTCVDGGLGPEEIIALHAEALEHAFTVLTPRQVASAGVDGLQFLLEVMIAYGIQYQRYLELRLAEQARQTELVQQQARTQAEIMRTISHELRTPVTVVHGSLDLAVRSLAQQQTERLPRLLETARQALDRLSRMTADLYEASRGEAPELARGPEDLAAIAAQAHTWAATSANEKGLALSYSKPPAALPVLGDADALLSVLSNLLSNAIRYTPQGGRVTMSTGDDDAGVWVEVADTGIGMSVETQARIFELFYRAPEAKNVDAQGLGLGLALVQRLVLAHDGEITVSSTPGSGSTFRVSLPRHSTAAGELPHDQEKGTRHAGA
jgi:signal transduction histidine kinase